MIDTLGLAEINADIYEFVRRYTLQFHSAVPLKVLAQKFAKRLLGFKSAPSLIKLLESDSRYIVELTRSGAFQVRLVAFAGLNSLIMHLLRVRGGVIPLNELKCVVVETYNFSLDDLKGATEQMLTAGIISLDGNQIELAINVD